MMLLKNIRLNKIVAGVGLALSTLLVAPSSFSQALPPQALAHIPDGRLKQSLSKLPAHIQQQVLDKLAALGIPAIDTLLMEADANGELFYVEEGLVELTEPAAESGASATALPPVDVFRLHSKPGAAKQIYLDFDGGAFSGRAWGSGASYDTLPYDLDGDPSSFNATELSRIHEIWTRIADDYAAFDVDVTTEAPNQFGPNVGWLLFTKDTDANGTAMPSQGAGGVAYVNVWGRSNFTYYQPALVYYNRLASAANYMAEAGSHEMGHNLGLSHDGTSTESYYRGLGANADLQSWAPIMGVGYDKNVTQWSRGEYPDANQTQDDIAIIGNKLGYAYDQEGNASSPQMLVIDSNGQFVATNRQTDPGNVVADNKGTVQVGDSDWFQFMAGTGNVQIEAVPAWAAFTRTSRRGANLDIGLRLYDQYGQLVADSANAEDTKASISTTLAEGIYVLEVYGTAGTYASDYASQGHYYLSGQVTVSTPDVTPPDPNPMRFAQLPLAHSASEIVMQAEVATDDRGGVVSYQFSCTSGGQGCADSAWQTSTQYTATNLLAETEYCFSVKARDLSGNQSTSSAVACASTAAEPPQVNPPVAPSGLAVQNGQNGTAIISWTDNSADETAFEIQRERLHKSGRWQDLQTLTTGADQQSFTDSSGADTFHYRVRASNAAGSSEWTAWAEVTVTGGSSSCRGKKCG
ncbi:zinc-dependent metalloprotease family protein [Aliiglaciecola sp. CAU 1673]|uniref:zinc-dependent metalloprotease family protein n=1 Tax=Aliiglaciecola sp. CAU 1673 TaxID=3032595 RepID=UPI0023DBCAFA|nr:M12 family metallo-peptidase [Aliiglaciecola sp. CAU 1673]MDF2178910.1 zinc-dependent metalloprotease family protein [Aliiglaciecola sp. CAU 1673]